MFEREKQENELIKQNSYDMQNKKDELKDVLWDYSIDYIDDNLLQKLLEYFDGNIDHINEFLSYHNNQLNGSLKEYLMKWWNRQPIMDNLKNLESWDGA